MVGWTKEERKVIKNTVMRNETDKDDCVEAVIAQLQAKGYLQRSKDAVAQQVREGRGKGNIPY